MWVSYTDNQNEQTTARRSAGAGEIKEISMSDLIDRQAAIATAIKAAVDWHKLANPQYSIAYCIGEAMRQLPPAQPEIIHCEECVFYEAEDGWCEMHSGYGFWEKAFCSFAKRREVDE